MAAAGTVSGRRDTGGVAVGRCARNHHQRRLWSVYRRRIAAAEGEGGQAMARELMARCLSRGGTARWELPQVRSTGAGLGARQHAVNAEPHSR
jgi:hypothetical protein